MNKISITLLCAVASLSSAAIAQVPERNHPAKAAPSAPLEKSKVNVTVPVSNVQPALQKKPPVVTAVAPKPLVPGGAQRKIIFVGGKNGDSALNTQPIPPGRATLDHAGLNAQPIPPGRATLDHAGLNTQPIPPGRNTLNHAGLNTQPIPPGRTTLEHSALNPQPIPPGRPPVDPVQ